MIVGILDVHTQKNETRPESITLQKPKQTKQDKHNRN